MMPQFAKDLGAGLARALLLVGLVFGSACGLSVGTPSFADDRAQYEATERKLVAQRVDFSSKNYVGPYVFENTFFNFPGSDLHLHGYSKSANRHVDYSFAVSDRSPYSFKASDSLILPYDVTNLKKLDAYATDRPGSLVGTTTFPSSLYALDVVGSTVYVVLRVGTDYQLHKWIPGTASSLVISLSDATGTADLNSVRQLSVRGGVVGLVTGYKLWKLNLGTPHAPFSWTLPATIDAIEIREDGALLRSPAEGLSFIDFSTLQKTSLSDLIKENAYRLNGSFTTSHYYRDGTARYGHRVVYHGVDGVFAYDWQSRVIQPILLDPFPQSPQDTEFHYRAPLITDSGYLYVVGSQGFSTRVYEVDLNQALR